MPGRSPPVPDRPGARARLAVPQPRPYASSSRPGVHPRSIPTAAAAEEDWPLPEQLTLDVFNRIAVEPTRDVLPRGADAISGRVFPFAHHHVPARPATVTGDRVWLAMLDLAEDARRYNQAGRAVLDLTARHGAGSNGPIGPGDLMLDGKGCENWRDKSRAIWPRAAHRPPRATSRRTGHRPRPRPRRGLPLPRQLRPRLRPTRLPRQRPQTSGSWRADRFIAQLARQVLDLGGDPTLLVVHPGSLLSDSGAVGDFWEWSRSPCWQGRRGWRLRWL